MIFKVNLIYALSVVLSHEKEAIEKENEKGVVVDGLSHKQNMEKGLCKTKSRTTEYLFSIVDRISNTGNTLPPRLEITQTNNS